MPTPTYDEGTNPFSAGDDFPSTDPSVTLPGGVSAVFCDYPFKATTKFKTLVVEAWDGSEKRSAQGAEKRTFELTFEQLTPTEADVLWNHYRAQSGQLYSFTYYDYQSGEAFTVRYADDSMSRSTFLFEAEKGGIKLVEVL